MAIIYNPLLGRITGKCGTVYFKKQFGKTVMQPIPTYNKYKVTDLQREHRKKLEAACLETRLIMRDKVRRAEYDAKCGPGYSLFHRVMREVLSE